MHLHHDEEVFHSAEPEMKNKFILRQKIVEETDGLQWEGYLDLECLSQVRSAFFQRFPLVQNADESIEHAKFGLAMRTVVYQRHNQKKRGDSAGTTPRITTADQQASSSIASAGEVVPTSDDDEKLVSCSQPPLQVTVEEPDEEDLPSSQQPLDGVAYERYSTLVDFPTM
ncbi:hypothetical protein EDD18DRAFT_1101947 [Armillaria luteobubalina]|uniref:Uncharacterized protein n=1 Tax=Armillaria luteobubalina TaxID=153913 RepID=A0AA39QG74_9AGAR|nr:hypothetical protein EDD18DRAFT_1101947 [Armillaria luteobubalina]